MAPLAVARLDLYPGKNSFLHDLESTHIMMFDTGNVSATEKIRAAIPLASWVCADSELRGSFPPLAMAPKSMCAAQLPSQIKFNAIVLIFIVGYTAWKLLCHELCNILIISTIVIFIFHFFFVSLQYETVRKNSAADTGHYHRDGVDCS